MLLFFLRSCISSLTEYSMCIACAFKCLYQTLQQGLVFFHFIPFVLFGTLLNWSIINMYNLVLSSGTVWCYLCCWQICLSLSLGSFSCLLSWILLIQAFHLSHCLPPSWCLSLSSVISFLCSILFPLLGLLVLFLFVTVSILVTDVVVRMSPLLSCLVSLVRGVSDLVLDAILDMSGQLWATFIVLIVSNLFSTFLGKNNHNSFISPCPLWCCCLALFLEVTDLESQIGGTKWVKANLQMFVLNMCI